MMDFYELQGCTFEVLWVQGWQVVLGNQQGCRPKARLARVIMLTMQGISNATFASTWLKIQS